MNPDGSPAKGVPVVVGPGDSHGQTGDNGMAKVSISAIAEASQLEITVSLSVGHVNE